MLRQEVSYIDNIDLQPTYFDTVLLYLAVIVVLQGTRTKLVVIQCNCSTYLRLPLIVGLMCVYLLFTKVEI